MANIPSKLKYAIEKLFQMSEGYVLDFSNASFARFISDSVNIDIYGGNGYTDYCSKANKLRQFISSEPDAVVGKLLNDMLIYCREMLSNNGKLDYAIDKKIEELHVSTSQMMEGALNIELPETKEETLQTLLEDINSALARNKPTLVLDRLHTFSTKYLRMICENKRIEVADGKGNLYPLHSLAGMLKKCYEKENDKSEFSVLAIQNSIPLFDKFNSIRNNQSYAHDNEILENIEAEFVVKTMANVLIFIDKLEGLKNTQKEHPKEVLDLPF